jgi:5-methylcytosine-specific restriction endonuclease McrA
MIELERPQRWLQPPWGMSEDGDFTMSNSKTCTKCGQTLSIDCFSPKPTGQNGLRAQCKECRAEYTRQWSANNKERKAESDRQYRKANPDKIRAGFLDWASRNPEKLKQYSANWVKNNSEKSRAIKKAWDQRNPNARRDKVNRYRAKAAKNRTFKILPFELKRIYNSPCFFCGTTQSIEADHIIARERGGDHSFGNLMPLCRSCNASKSDKTIMEFRVWKKRMGR